MLLYYYIRRPLLVRGQRRVRVQVACQLVCSGESEGYRSSGASRIGILVIVLHSSLFSACLPACSLPAYLPACSLPACCLGPGILGPGILGLACSLALSFSRALSLMEHRGIEASKHRSKEASKRRSLHEASKHWRIEVSKYRSIGSSSRGRRNSGVASKSAAPCRRAKHWQQLRTISRGGLPPPPSSAGRRHSTDPLHGSPMDRPWIDQTWPLEPSWRSLGRLQWLLFAVLGVLCGSWSSLGSSQCLS